MPLGVGSTIVSDSEFEEAARQSQESSQQEESEPEPTVEPEPAADGAGAKKGGDVVFAFILQEGISDPPLVASVFSPPNRL